MRIVLEIAETDTAEALEELSSWVESVNARAEQRIRQSLPGMMMEHGDGVIWVKSAKVLDTESDIR